MSARSDWSIQLPDREASCLLSVPWSYKPSMVRYGGRQSVALLAMKHTAASLSHESSRLSAILPAETKH